MENLHDLMLRHYLLHHTVDNYYYLYYYYYYYYITIIAISYFLKRGMQQILSSHRIFQPPISAYLLPQLFSLLLLRFCSLYVSLLFTMLLLSVAAVWPLAVSVSSTAGGNMVGRKGRHVIPNFAHSSVENYLV